MGREGERERGEERREWEHERGRGRRRGRERRGERGVINKVCKYMYMYMP